MEHRPNPGSVGGRKSNPDGCPSTRLALHADLTTVLLNDPLRDGEPEAGATRVTGSGRVGSVEPFEDTLNLVGRNADS